MEWWGPKTPSEPLEAGVPDATLYPWTFQFLQPKKPPCLPPPPSFFNLEQFELVLGFFLVFCF